MRLKAGTTIVYRGERYTVTGQRGGWIIAVREGEEPDDMNYRAFRAAAWIADAEAKHAKWRALVESWELVDA